MSNDEDKGGMILGGIDFGVAPRRASEGSAERAAPGDESAPTAVDGFILPMRMLVLAELVPRGEFNAGILAPESPLSVHAAELDALFAKLSPRLALDVESVLHEGKTTRVDVPLASLQSFRPDALCQNVPLLRSLLDGKKVLEHLSLGTTTLDAAANELARLWKGSPFLARVLGSVEVSARNPNVLAPAPAAQPNDAADRILDMLDLGAPSNEENEAISDPPRGVDPAGGRFDSFLAAVAHSGKTQPSARAADGIRHIEKALGMQVGAILQHPEFRRLEEAWRGLAFLVGRMPKSGVRVDVLSCRTEDAPAALRRVANEGLGVVPPLTLALIDGAVTGDAASLAWLREVAEAAQENAVVALTNATPRLFAADLDEVERLDNKQALFDAPQRAPWRAEANRPAALWVSLALNRLLARTAYDAKSSRIREATVSEVPAGPESEVWLQPAWAIAALAAQSHARFEWPCGITGARDGGVIENLPVREVSLPSGERIAFPTEAFFSTETQRALGRIGLCALASRPNSDSAYLLCAATAYVPPPKRTYDGGAAEFDERLPQASLGDQLFVARLAQQLEWLGLRIVRDGAAADARKLLAAGLDEMFRNAPPPGPEVGLELGEEFATVTVRPRRFLGVALEELSLRVRLR